MRKVLRRLPTPRQLKLPLDIDEKGKMTAIEYTIYEQPQPLEL